jgi:hypothetical protein
MLVVKKLLGESTRQVAPRLTLLPLSKAGTDCITFYRFFALQSLLYAMVVHLCIGIL